MNDEETRGTTNKTACVEDFASEHPDGPTYGIVSISDLVPLAFPDGLFGPSCFGHLPNSMLKSR